MTTIKNIQMCWISPFDDSSERNNLIQEPKPLIRCIFLFWNNRHHQVTFRQYTTLTTGHYLILVSLSQSSFQTPDCLILLHTSFGLAFFLSAFLSFLKATGMVDDTSQLFLDSLWQSSNLWRLDLSIFKHLFFFILGLSWSIISHVIVLWWHYSDYPKKIVWSWKSKLICICSQLTTVPPFFILFLNENFTVSPEK